MKRWAMFAAVFLFVSPALAAGPGEDVAESFARPALAAFVQASAGLAGTANRLCETPDAPTLGAARAAFRDTVRAFGRIMVLRFGPLVADNRLERIFFWPDPRGAALRQVQGALADKDASLTDPAALAGKSVALQGLPALDVLLFGTGAEELGSVPGGFRCRFASAIATGIGLHAQEIAGGWAGERPFAASFAAPAPNRDPYRTLNEVNAEIVKALVTVVQFVRAAELEPPFGADVASANGKRAPLWRSEASFTLVAAQLEGARDLLVAAGYENTLPEDMRWLPGQIRFQMDNARRALERVGLPPEEAFTAQPDRDRIAYAKIALDGAGHDLSEKLSAALGLSVGFNALDGD